MHYSFQNDFQKYQTKWNENPRGNSLEINPKLRETAMAQGETPIRQVDTTNVGMNGDFSGFHQSAANMASKVAKEKRRSEQSQEVNQEDIQAFKQQQGIIDVPDAPITQKFGNQSSVEKYSGGVNYGTDIGVSKGTRVALPSGKWRVIKVFDGATDEGTGNSQQGINSGYGNSILVENIETGEQVRFSHLSPGGVFVKQGQEINGGTIIGATGATGNVAGATGEHLDIEYYDQNGRIGDFMKSQYSKELLGAREMNSEEKKMVEAPNKVQEVAMQVMDRIPTEVKKSTDTETGYETNTDVLEVVPQQARESAIKNIPLIEKALKDEGIYSPEVMAYALATIQHETAGTFQPIEEYGGRQQAIKNGYDGGENYYGRGFIQLTHKSNYNDIGQRIGIPELADNPELALNPEVSAKILAAFFKDRGVADLAAKGDFYNARYPVNLYDRAGEIKTLAQNYLRYLQ